MQNAADHPTIVDAMGTAPAARQQWLEPRHSASLNQ
jgi:hypothetical protein